MKLRLEKQSGINVNDVKKRKGKKIHMYPGKEK